MDEPNLTLLAEWRGFCDRYGRKTQREQELYRAAAARPPGGIGGLLPTVDWLGGAPLSREESADRSEPVIRLWPRAVDEAQGVYPVLWVLYRTRSLVVRMPNRVIVGVQAVPIPIWCGVAEPSANDASNDVSNDVSASWLSATAAEPSTNETPSFWCRAWTGGAAGESRRTAGEVAQWIHRVIEELVLPEHLPGAPSRATTREGSLEWPASLEPKLRQSRTAAMMPAQAMAPLDERFCKRAFETCDGSGKAALAAALADVLAERLRGAPEFHRGVHDLVERLRALGHDLWSFDASDEMEAWCPNYVTPTGPGIVVTFTTGDEDGDSGIVGVEVAWTYH